MSKNISSLVQFPAGISRHLPTQDLHSLQKCNGNTALTQSFFTYSPWSYALTGERCKKDCANAVFHHIFVDYEDIG